MLNAVCSIKLTTSHFSLKSYCSLKSLLIILQSSIFLFCFSAQAQVSDKTLETQIAEYNNKLEYEKSIKLLSDFIARPKNGHYEKYEAYILKSYTYKRLFNYEAVFRNLDLALAEGLQTDKAETVQQVIKAEKTFAYFDIHEYKKSAELMRELSESKYKQLSEEQKAFLLMQEGYLQMLDKNYPEAERKLDEALALAKICMPRNQPNILAKKVELYNAAGSYEKRDKAFAEGMAIAEQYNILKYKLYLYEMLKNCFMKNKDYKNLYLAQKSYDSLAYIYNTIENNAKIEFLEQSIKDEKQTLELRNEKNTRWFLSFLSAILVILLVISVRLYIVNRAKRRLTEEENKRIHTELEHLTKQLNEKRIDLSKFDLSERQLEIAALIKQGKTNKEIGEKLFISENTVKYHLKMLYHTLNIDSRSKLE